MFWPGKKEVDNTRKISKQEKRKEKRLNNGQEGYIDLL